MARKVVTVDETTLLLPTAVSNALKADLNTAFSAARTEAVNAASTATSQASQASTAASAAEEYLLEMQETTDAQVSALVNTVGSSTRAAVLDVAQLASGSATKRAYSMSRLPIDATGLVSYNGAAHIQDNITVDGNDMYAVWWGHDLKPYIGKKTGTDGAWSTFDLSTISGNPLASPVPLDGHNALVVEVDSLGYIHVWGNMHNHAMRYTRSTSPRSITSWVTASMVGTNETSVTYPAPVKTPDGTLYFAYREGVASNGKYYLDKYNAGTQTWSRVGLIIDSDGTESPYINKVVPGPDNSLHFFFLWRGSTSANANNDLGYFKILSSGAARKGNGTIQTLPVTHANMDLIVDTDATGSGMLNQQGADIDAQGRPHAAIWLHDGSGNTQINHVHFNGSTWQVDKVTNLTKPIDLNLATFNPALSRAQVVCPVQGGAYILYRCNYDGKENAIRMIDVSDGPATVEFKISDINFYDWEPIFSTQALKQRNELTMLMIPLAANADSSTAVPWNANNNWNRQVVIEMSVDLGQINLFRAGAVTLPEIEIIKTRGGPPAGTNITAVSTADFAHGPITHWLWDKETLFVRHTARVNAGSSTTVFVEVRSYREKPSISGWQVATASSTGAVTNWLRTPWALCYNFGNPDDAGFFVLYAYKTGAATPSVSAATLELGKLRGLTS